MVNIGETILDEDAVQEIREAIDCRREELKKVQKKMIEAKLDPREPQSKLACLYNLKLLLDPDGQMDAVAEAEVQGDAFREAIRNGVESFNRQYEGEGFTATVRVHGPTDEELEQDRADFFGTVESEPATAEAEEPEGMVVTDLEQTPDAEPAAEPVAEQAEAPEEKPKKRRSRKAKKEEPAPVEAVGDQEPVSEGDSAPEAATEADSSPGDQTAPVEEANPLDFTRTGPHRFYLGSVHNDPDSRCIIDRSTAEIVDESLPHLIALGKVRRLNGVDVPAEPEANEGPARDPVDVLILEAVTRRPGAAERWQARVESGLTDDQLVQALRDEIGPGDKGMTRAGSWKSSGGVHPLVNLSVPGVSGGQSFLSLKLAARVREILGIPMPQEESEASAVCEDCFADLVDGVCPDPECGAAQAVGVGQ